MAGKPFAALLRLDGPISLQVPKVEQQEYGFVEGLSSVINHSEW